MTVVLLDTGPLVAYFNGPDQHHVWAARQFGALQCPVLTCEAVWTEAAHLLSTRGGRPGILWPLLRRGAVEIDFSIKSEHESLAALMDRYEDLPMSLADACLVRMSELYRESRVLTTDGHFRYYRRFGRQVIPVTFPN